MGVLTLTNSSFSRSVNAWRERGRVSAVSMLAEIYRYFLQSDDTKLATERLRSDF